LEIRLKVILFLVLAALLAALAGPATAATELLSYVNGHVKTTNGDAVAGCTVQLSCINGTIASTTTDSTGYYSLEAPLGTYTIQAYKLTIVDNYVGSVSTSVLHSTTKDIALKPLPSKFTLTQSKSSIVADGLDYTALTAHITDAWDRVVPDCTVSLDNEETGLGTLSNSPTKATSSTITLTHDAGANYVGYYGWASNPGTGKVGQAAVKLIVTQPSTDFSSTQYFYINVKAAPTPTPSVNAPTSEALPGTAAPVTTASFQGQPGEAPGTYASDVEVILTATDNSGSGILRTEYSLGNMSWITYSGPFNISNDGNTTIYYRSLDNSKNIEDTKTALISIVRATPTSSTRAYTAMAENETATASGTPSTAPEDQSSGPCGCCILVILPLLAMGIMAYANRKKGGRG
jgi:hypothetical protein